MYTVANPDPYPREGVNYLTLRVQFYANECNSTLTSVTRGTYPYPDSYIYKCSLVVWNLGSPVDEGEFDFIATMFGMISVVLVMFRLS